MSLLPKFTSVYEGFQTVFYHFEISVAVSQIIGENFRQKYPDIFDKDDLTAFKKELLEFFILTPEDMDKVGGVLSSVRESFLFVTVIQFSESPKNLFS